MRIALVYHKDPYADNPRGGELSVRAICEYLKYRGHEVVRIPYPSISVITTCDLVLTWGKPALNTAVDCQITKTPLVTMVRWWRNIAPRPVGDLMRRNVDQRFVNQYELLFSVSKAIITNNTYSKNVIERWQPTSKGKVHVSYVPILGDSNQGGDENGYLTVVTPEIYGEVKLVKELAKRMPEEKFLVVNTPDYHRNAFKGLTNVNSVGYMDMKEVWSQTKILLLPIYENDVCGTRRVTIEALRSRIPVICSDRCGLNEKIPTSMLVTRSAKPKEWVAKITEINTNYRRFCNVANKTWEKYDTQGQLEGFEKTLLQCAS